MLLRNGAPSLRMMFAARHKIVTPRSGRSAEAALD
jgi:hypothetical protein